MNKQISLSPGAILSAIGLIVAASGILLQIYSGVGNATIPVGAIVMLIVAALIFLRVWRWTVTLGAVVALFILIGAIIAPGLTNRLSNPSQVGPFVGTVLQLAGLATAILAGGYATLLQINSGREQTNPSAD